MSLDADLTADVYARFDAMEGNVLGLAVSGGGDSMALLALAHDWARRRLAAVTVDHGLRAESASEAHRVASYCSELGIPHEIVLWEGWDGQGNMQDAARQARASLIADWALSRGISSVATGHTQDDQAETFLMRLARGSGVDGLSAMAPSRVGNGITWHRPLLAVSRAALRDHLAAEGLPWIDDPSNEDTRFDRIKARRALDVLADLGLTAEGLAATAARMGRARTALDGMTDELLTRAARLDRGDVLLNWPMIGAAHEEIANRAFARALMWVSGSPYRPRAASLTSAIEAMEARRTHVLMGCQMSAEGSSRRIAREFAAVSEHATQVGEVWDRRWSLSGPGGAPGEVRALGEPGIRACPDWRESGLPRASLLASPSVWQGDRLVAAPLAGFGRGWRADLVAERAKLV